MNVKLLCFFAIIFSSSAKLNAFNNFFPPAQDSLSVIMACYVGDNDKLNQVKKLIHGESTIKYVDFCTNHSVFLLKIAGTQSAADEFVNKVRKETNADRETVYVKAYSFGDIQPGCVSDYAPFGKPKQ